MSAAGQASLLHEVVDHGQCHSAGADTRPCRNRPAPQLSWRTVALLQMGQPLRRPLFHSLRLLPEGPPPGPLARTVARPSGGSAAHQTQVSRDAGCSVTKALQPASHFCASLVCASLPGRVLVGLALAETENEDEMRGTQCLNGQHHCMAAMHQGHVSERGVQALCQTALYAALHDMCKTRLLAWLLACFQES